MKRSGRRITTPQNLSALPKTWQLLLAIAIAMATSQCSHSKGRDSVTTQGSNQKQVPSTALPEPPLEELGGGKNIFAIVDDSFSMNKSDRHNLRWEGAKLMLALAREDDNFAAIAFAGDGQTVCPLTRVGGRARRQSIFERLEMQTGLTLSEGSGRWTKRKGKRWRDYTNFAAAFRATGIELQKAPGDSHTMLVLLTDGDNNFPQTDETTVLRSFRQNVPVGIPLCGMALRRKGDSTLLRRLTAESGGPYFPVARSEGLLDAYIEASEILQDLVMLRDARRGKVSLHPGTRDFLLIVLRGKEKARIESLKAGRKAVRLDEDPHLHHFITQQFEVVNVPDPAKITNAPSWTWEITSPTTSIARVAKRPPWEFRAVKPLGDIAFDAPIAIAAELKNSSIFPDGFEKALRAECSVTPVGEPERSAVEMEIHRFGALKLGLLSTDQTGLKGFDMEGQWRIHVTMSIRDDVDQTWLLDRNWLVNVIEPKPKCVMDYAVKGVLRLAATVAGCRVQTWEGALLAGDCPEDVTVTLPETIVLEHSAEPSSTLEVDVRPRISTYPRGLAPAGTTIQLEVRKLPVSAVAGIYRGEIRALAQDGRVQLPSDPLPIEAEVTREFCRFDTTSGFGNVILGEKHAIAEWSVENVSCRPLLVRFTIGRLTSESGLTLPPECLQLSKTELKLDTATRGGVRFSLVSSRDFPLGRFRSRVKLDVYDAEGRSVLQSAFADLEGVFGDH